MKHCQQSTNEALPEGADTNQSRSPRSRSRLEKSCCCCSSTTSTAACTAFCASFSSCRTLSASFSFSAVSLCRQYVCIVYACTRDHVQAL